jgi:hypothetical protein
MPNNRTSSQIRQLRARPPPDQILRERLEEKENNTLA